MLTINKINNQNYYNNTLSKNHVNFRSDKKKIVTTATAMIGAGITAAQNIAIQKINQSQIKEFTPNDINMSYTCCGYGEIQGNSRSVNDFRSITYHDEGWKKNPMGIHVYYNKNGDERRNGPTTALVFPLPKETHGLRGGDNFTVLINGHVEIEDLNKLIKILKEKNVMFDFSKCNGYSTPNQPIFRQNVAKVLNYLQQQKMQNVQGAEEVKPVEKTPVKSKFNIKTTDINIVDFGFQQDDNNSRNVKDYLRVFLSNGAKKCVVHDKFVDEKGNEKDATIMLFPASKDASSNKWDFWSLSIDANISEEDFNNGIKNLAQKGITNTGHAEFKNSLVEYFNNL